MDKKPQKKDKIKTICMNILFLILFFIFLALAMTGQFSKYRINENTLDSSKPSMENK